MIFVEQSLARGPFRGNDSLVAIEDWNIDGHIETTRVHIGSVAGLYKRSRHFWELRKNGRAHRGVLALETLLQSKKIEPARFEPIEQATLIWRGKARWQSEAFRSEERRVGKECRA